MRKQALEIRPGVSLSRDPPYLKWDPHSQQGFIPEDLGRAQRAETCLREKLSPVLPRVLHCCMCGSQSFTWKQESQSKPTSVPWEESELSQGQLCMSLWRWQETCSGFGSTCVSG